MKKMLFALVIGLLLVAALTTTALADNGPHGGAAFANGATDACAGCHRAHNARSNDGFLLVATDVYALCTSCHDGTGAFTDVVDGYYTQGSWNAGTHGTAPAGTILAGAQGMYGEEGLGLFAGGIRNARMAHTWNGHNYYSGAGTYPTGAQVTDAHEVGQGLFTALGTMWGAGDTATNNGTGIVLTTALECTDCHDPHGNAGRTGNVNTGAPIPSYRLLRFNPTGSNGFEVASETTAGVGLGQYFTGQTGTTGGYSIADVATHWYTPNTDSAFDPTVYAYRTRWSGTAYTSWQSIIAQPGDYAGRSYMYQVPAIGTNGGTVAAPRYYTLSGGNTSGMYTCLSGGLTTGTLPALPATQIVGAPVSGTNYYPCPGAPSGTAFNNNTPRGAMGQWCSLCHDRYLAPGGSNTTFGAGTTLGSRVTPSGDVSGNFMFRHATTGSVVCVDCHVAHGTTAAEYQAAGLTTNYGQTATLNLANPSDLLKLDNRGMCARCHGMDVNFQFVP